MVFQCDMSQLERLLWAYSLKYLTKNKKSAVSSVTPQHRNKKHLDQSLTKLMVSHDLPRRVVTTLIVFDQRDFAFDS